MSLEWTPTPGDRIRTVISASHANEIVYLNDDNAITTTVADEFLIFTSEWLPWPHQIIDYLSALKGRNRQTILHDLLTLDKANQELDFDQLCQKLLQQYEQEEAKKKELIFSNSEL